MGFGRFLMRMVPGYEPVRLLGKVMEKGIEEGVKENLQEYIYEDNPLTSAVYNSGKNKGHTEGMKDGYDRASKEYEKKLLAQADAFLKESGNIRVKCEEYKSMMIEYESYIADCEKIIEDLPEAKRRLLELMKEKYAALKDQEPHCNVN